MADLSDNGGDEELDAALDMELAASFLTHPLASHRHDVEPSPNFDTRRILSVELSSQLTFAFPGWGVDISRDVKGKRPSILRHVGIATSNEGREKACSETGKSKQKDITWEGPEGPRDGSPVDSMPDEVLVHILRRVQVRDICAGMQTCKRWHRLGSRNDIWEQFTLASNAHFLKTRPKNLPRWVIVKNCSISQSVSCRFSVFLKGYEYLLRALNAWWDSGRPDVQYNSATLHSLIRKLTANDWSLLYEAFGVAFSAHADLIANILMFEIGKTANLIQVGRKAEADKRFSRSSGLKCFCAGAPRGMRDDCSCWMFVQQEEQNSDWDGRSGLGKKGENDGARGRGEIGFKSRSLALDHSQGACDDGISLERGENDRCEEVLGKEIWKKVHNLWMRYKRWLMLVITHCPELNHEVMVERARGFTLSATPTLYDKGVICFRSQVVLRYGLRSLLQVAFAWLVSTSANLSASDADMDLLKSLYHLLQELDVADDFTLPSSSFTQPKLWRCFPCSTSSTRKLQPFKLLDT